ncbi:hypothetical protein Hanom_Chr16g01440651 [Helianthus anomalus]
MFIGSVRYVCNRRGQISVAWNKSRKRLMFPNLMEHLCVRALDPPDVKLNMSMEIALEYELDWEHYI